MSNKIWIVPLESLSERYTEQWRILIPPAFMAAGFDAVVIDGDPLSDHVGVGTFLDINSTVAYKNSQMIQIATLFHTGQVKDGDKFFIYDAEFWGLESIRLMAQMNKIDVKIGAFLHAASYSREDAFEVAAPYQKYTELGWLACCDYVFVGSEYHMRAIIDRRIKPYASEEDVGELVNKIIVTGNPLFKDAYPEYRGEKKNQIIISNRFDWEKRPNLSLDFAYILKKKHPDWKIIVTTGRKEFKSNKQWLVDYAKALEEDGIIEIHSGLTKNEYHRFLAESKVMLTNSIEENFGYCAIEAVIYNTYPLMKNELSHPELVQNNSRLLFDDEDEIVSKVEYLMENEIHITPYAVPYFKSLDKIIAKFKE